jgi:hypothetical protein
VVDAAPAASQAGEVARRGPRIRDGIVDLGRARRVRCRAVEDRDFRDQILYETKSEC